MDGSNIVILDAKGMNPGDLSWDLINELGDVLIYDNTSYDDIVSKSKDAQIVVINKCRFDSFIIDQLPNLRYICVSATGFDNVDVEYAKTKGILVSNVKDYSTMSVVQQVFSLIFALTNKAEYYNNEVKRGRWANHDFFTFWDAPIEGLEGKIIGLYGFGKIASKVAGVANAFGMKVIANRKNPSKGYPDYVTHVEVEDLFKKSDILSLHAPLVDENINLINKETLKLMKSSSLLINTSRGLVINENDLYYALDSGIISGAGVDVLSAEPPKHDNPLLKSDKCIITPHQAWASVQSRRKLMSGVIGNIKSFLNGKPLNIVN